MSYAGLSRSGRFAARLASAFAPPYMDRFYLARFGSNPYVDPQAILNHDQLSVGPQAFIADRVIIHKAKDGGPVELAESVHILRDSVLETGHGGAISIGRDTFLHPRSQVMAYCGSIRIGAHVAVAPNCALYSYNHGTASGELVKRQPLSSRGGITIGDDVWIGFGVIVLDGVTIGSGAIVGAGSVVTDDIPENAIAVGNPARIVSTRAARH